MKIFQFALGALAIICALYISSCNKTPLGNNVSTLGGSQKDSIVYTDVNPDSVIALNQSYQVDMNNDGAYDFSFSMSRTLGRCAPDCSPMFNNTAKVFRPDISDSNSVINYSPTCQGCALALDTNAAINPAAHWSTSAEILYDVQSCSCGTNYVAGYWGTSSFKYLGVRFSKNSSYYYGWIKLITTDVYKNGGLIVSGYAYNNIPNHSISAGQTH